MKELPEDKKPFVKLIGADANAAGIIARTKRALEDAKSEAKTKAQKLLIMAAEAEKDALMYEAALKGFTKEATSGDYDHVLQTVLGVARDRSEREISEVELQISVPTAVVEEVIRKHALVHYPGYIDGEMIERIFAAYKELLEDYETSDSTLANLIETGIEQADYNDDLYETCRDCGAREPECHCDEYEEEDEFEEDD